MTGRSSLHMLNSNVRTAAFRLLYSLTALTALLQPLVLAEQPFVEPLTALTADDAVDQRRVRLIELPETLGHTHYPDVLLGAPGEIDTLVVVAMEDLTPPYRTTIERVSRSMHVAVIAPRQGLSTRAEAIATIPGVGRDTLVVYPTLADRSRWRLAVAGRVAPAWVAEAIVDTSEAPFSPALVNAARLGLGRRDIVVERALDLGQSAVGLDIASPDALEEIVTPVASAIAADRDQELRRYEQNYLIVPAIFSILSPTLITESALIWSIVAVAAILILYAVSRPRRVGRYVSAIRHNIVLFLGIFSALAGGLIFGNIAIRIVDNFFPVGTVSIALTIAKYAVALLVLIPLYPLVHRRFRRSSTVYSGAALFLLIIGALIASIFSVILGAFFVVAFVFGFLFSLSHRPIFKTFFLFLAFTPSTYLLIAIASAADAATIQTLLIPPIWRELVVTVLLLPLMLMLFRLDILVRRVPIVPLVVMVSAVAAAISMAVTIEAFSQPASGSVRILERYPPDETMIDGSIPDTGELLISGQMGAIPFEFVRDGEAVLRCEEPPCSAIVPAPPPPVTVDAVIGGALDRVTVEYSVTFRRPPRSVTISIRTGVEVQLYASDLPTETSIGDTVSDFAIRPGPYPPPTVRGTVVLRNVPPETRLTLAAEATFSGRSGTISTAADTPTPSVSSHREMWTVRTERTIQ